MTPYRCETCKNIDCDLHADNPGNINQDTGDTYNHFHWYYAILDKKGCASHSDFQSVCDKVLDDVKDAIDEFMILNAKGHALHYELWEVIEKVRQAGSP
jgi:hypothetical protein